MLTMTKADLIWEATISEESNSDLAVILLSYGKVSGKRTQTNKTVIGKNIGKSNETTALVQAWNEILSLGATKIDKGYILINPDVVNGDERFIPTDTIKPMLAVSYSEKLIDSEMFIQPKLDGVRCVAYLKNGDIYLQSRTGKAFMLETVKKALEPLFFDNPKAIFDGEIYVHGWTFQRIVSAVKKQSEDTKLLQYHIYDIVVDEAFHLRTELLNKILLISSRDFKTIRAVETRKISKDKIDFYKSEDIKNGYEGSMIRSMHGFYRQDKRSHSLIKCKEFQDSEFIIVGGVAEELHNGEKGVVYSVQNTDKSISFNVRPRGTMEERTLAFKSLVEDIGSKITVRYQGLTELNVPRFPVAIGVRNYE